MALDRTAVKKPTLPKEAVEVGSLGGEVVVRGMLLSERMELFASPEEKQFERITEILAKCVLAADGKPLFTFDDWQIFGAANVEDALKLFNVARRLSGLGGAAEKKDESTPS